MAVGKGFKSYVQFGREAAYGTVVPATHKLEILPGTELPLDIGVIRDPSLYNSVSRRGLYQGGLKTKGKLRFRCNYEGLAMLLDWAMGSDTFGAVGGTDSGPVNGIYAHSFIQRAELNSYTVELGLGDIPAGKVFQLSGAIVTAMTISGQASGSGDNTMLTVELEVLGKVQLSNQAPTGALNLPTLTPMLFHQMIGTLFQDGVATGAALRPRSFTLAVKNNVSEDDFFLGSLTPDQPVRSNFSEVTMEIEQKFQDQALFEAARNFTATDGVTNKVRLEFYDTRTPGPRYIIISLRSANLVSYSPPIRDYGQIFSTARWEGWYDTVDTSAVIIISGNTKATISTAY